MSQKQIAARMKQRPAERVVYFATGTAAEVAADFRQLRLDGEGSRLRVVAPAEFAARLPQMVPVSAQEVIAYHFYRAPLIWIQLAGFLGFSSPVEVLCLTSPQRFRFLKLLALTLRGRVIFSPISGDRFPLGFLDLAGIWVRQRWDARECARKHLPVGVVGSASGYYLGKILPILRSRYPGAPVHGLLLSTATASTAALFDSVQVLRPGIWNILRQGWRLWRARKTYQRWILPCTNEPYPFLKFIAFLWPLSRRQIYNELADGFAVRNVQVFCGHLRWRLRDRMSFQIIGATAGRSLPVRIIHLFGYAARILGAVPLLLWTRFRAIRKRWMKTSVGVPAGGRQRGGTLGNETLESGKQSMGRSGALAPRFPGEPDSSIGLK